MNSVVPRLIVSLLFLLSGIAALIYQVAWQRLLVVFAGGDVYSITIIVTAFMIGIGLGGLAGGSLADRGSNLQSLIWFAGVELAISIFGFFSKAFFYDTLYLEFSWMAGSRWITAPVLVAALLVPTFLMGMSLPLLARAMIGNLADAATLTGRLYGVNTLGAALGALAATWALIPLHGLEGAIRWAAMFNAISAIATVPLVWWCLAPAKSAHASQPKEPSITAGITENWSLGRCLLICAFSGFLALALEMVWFRLLGVMLKSNAHTFGTLLSIYLAGIGIGSLAGMTIARRSTRPARTFLWMQFSIGVYAGLMVALVLIAVEKWDALIVIRKFFGSYEPLDADSYVGILKGWFQGTLGDSQSARRWLWLFPTLHVLLPLLLMGPPTFLMGFSYPFLQKAVQSDLASVGRRTGWVQSANIAGCMLGAVVTTTVLFSAMGTAGTMRLLVGLSGIFGLLAAVGSFTSGARRGRMLMGATVVLVTALAIMSMPDRRLLWSRTHGTTRSKIHYAEDGAGLSVVKQRPDGQAIVYVNGLGQSSIPFGNIHSELGALPAMLHPNPEDIAIIGLGSGDTLYCAGGRKETRSIVNMEIIGAQWETLEAHDRKVGYPPLRACLTDPRIEHFRGDGRHYLMNSSRRFDIIEADALRPTSAHSGMFYSEEYFRLMSSRLKPGGFAVTWAATPRVRDTFVRVFSHVLDFGPIIIGSNDPFNLDPSQIKERVADAVARRYYEHVVIDLNALVKFTDKGIAAGVIGPETDRSGLGEPNTDLFPAR